eukprot:6582281-Alexandrium_andersonii.AAC.1
MLGVVVSESSADVGPGPGAEQSVKTAERKKHARCPRTGLAPVALGTRGSWGAEGLLRARGVVSR